MRRVFVAAQLAAAYILLLGAALLISSLVRFASVNPGFRPAGLVGLHVDLSASRYAEDATRVRFHEEVMRGLSTLPGVESAAMASALPLGGIHESGTIVIDGERTEIAGGSSAAVINAVTEGYFATAGVTIVRGRAFLTDDRAGSTPVAIVNQAFARRFFGDGDPVGHQLSVPAEPQLGASDPAPDQQVIVGVVEDIRQKDTELSAAPEVFLPLAQRRSVRSDFVIRTRSSPSIAMNQLAAVVRTVDPRQPIARMFVFEDQLTGVVAARKLSALVLGAFALIALALGVMGLYGVAAQAAAQRAREIGVRTALGATAGQVVALMVRENMQSAFVGLAVGIPLALILSRVLGTLLLQVGGIDVGAIAIVATVLLLTAAIATYVPSRRASRLDPSSVMRSS